MTKNETVMLAGGSSISGVFVSCYSSLESCLQSCYMSCYIADFCNDKPGDVVACAPALTSPLSHFAMSSEKVEIETTAFRIFTSSLHCLTERFPWTQKGIKLYFGELTPCNEVDWRMIILTLIFVISLCGCCCMICFCSPCCFCAVWWRKRRARRNRGRADFTTYPSAPPLLSKA